MDEAAVEAAISNCTSLETLDVRFCPKVSANFNSCVLIMRKTFSFQWNSILTFAVGDRYVR